MEPKTGKRIVSKGEYVRVRGKRLSLLVFGGILLCVCGMAVLLALSNILPAFNFANSHADGKYVTGETHYSGEDNFKLVLLAGIILFFAGKWAMNLLRQAAAIEPVVPLNRANTPDLPAPDSLVRASAEPPQAQEAVLLRAAEGQETPPEQLVRPVNGQE